MGYFPAKTGEPEGASRAPDAGQPVGSASSDHWSRLTIQSTNATKKPNRSKRHEILHLIETFRGMERPFVMHGKSGADRVGFASVLYRAIIDGGPVPEARSYLSLRYMHLSSGATGIADPILGTYEARNASSPISLEERFCAEHDHRNLAARQAAVTPADTPGSGAIGPAPPSDDRPESIDCNPPR